MKMNHLSELESGTDWRMLFETPDPDPVSAPDSQLFYAVVS